MRAVTRPIAVLLTCSLWCPPALAWTQAQDPAPTYTKVDAKVVDKTGAITQQIHDTWTSTTEPGVAWTDDAQAANRVRVIVQWIDSDAMHYGFTLEATRSDGKTESFRGECQTCTDEELVVSITGSINKVGEFLRAVPDEHAAEPVAQPVGDTGSEDGASGGERVSADLAGVDDYRDGGFKEMSRMSKVGIGVGAVGVVSGVAAIVTGAIALDAKRQQRDLGYRRNNNVGELEDRHGRMSPIAVATGIAGAVLIAGGATLFVLGKGRDDRVAILPTLAPTFAGLSLSGRF